MYLCAHIPWPALNVSEVGPKLMTVSVPLLLMTLTLSRGASSKEERGRLLEIVVAVSRRYGLALVSTESALERHHLRCKGLRCRKHMLCEAFGATEAANRPAAADRTADSVAEAEHVAAALPVDAQFVILLSILLRMMIM